MMMGGGDKRRRFNAASARGRAGHYRAARLQHASRAKFTAASNFGRSRDYVTHLFR